MSDSAETVAGEGAESPRDVRQDIDAEIADHLAMSAQAAARAGAAGEDALHAAKAKFGSVNRVRFQCWWVNQGDLVMRKAAIYGGLVLLVGLLVAGVALPTIASLSSVRDNVQQLTTQLSALTKAQQDLIEKQSAAQAPVELKGKCYLKTEDVPAAGADVEIWNADEMTLIRQVRTDEKGEFNSGYLPPGMYFALATLRGKFNARVPWEVGSQKGWAPRYAVQSGPIPLYPGATNRVMSLNVYFPAGDIGFRLSEKLNGSGTILDTGIKYSAEVMIICLAQQDVRVPHNLISSPPPSSWPLTGERMLLSGQYPIQPPELALDQVFWISSRRPADAYITNGAILGTFSVGAVMYVANSTNSSNHALQQARSHAWQTGAGRAADGSRVLVEVKDKQQSVLQISVPSQSELDEMLKQRIEKTTEPQVRKDLPLVLYEAVLDVKQISTEDLDEARLAKALEE